MLDKSICRLCQFNGKCKHVSSCKSNELGHKAKAYATEKIISILVDEGVFCSVTGDYAKMVRGMMEDQQ